MKKCGKYITYNHAIEEYKKLLADKEFLKPDMYIFLYANEEIRNERNFCRSKILSKNWIDSDFIDYQNEFYKLISKKIKNRLEIDTGEKEPSYVSGHVLELLRRTHNSSTDR